MHQVLRKRVYTGDFDWDGSTYQGAHEPIVTRDVWERVQDVLNDRAKSKQHRIKPDFAFTGFIRCGHCGCQLVGELKKGRYVYYHYTGHRGKCPEPYTREEIMADQFANSLRELVIPREVLTCLNAVVTASDMNEQAAREKAVNKAQASELLRKVNEVRAATPAPVKDAINLMDLTSRAADLFLAQEAHEQQRFLRLVLKSASWRAGELRTEFEEPFESLRRSNRLNLSKHKENQMGTPEIENWLPKKTSFIRPLNNASD